MKPNKIVNLFAEMAGYEYEQIYRSYIEAVSAQDFDRMNEFIADKAIFNGILMTPKAVGEQLASFTRRCEQGLHFEILDLVVDANKGNLAARLAVSGKPTQEFFGYAPTGRTMKFKEVNVSHISTTALY